MFSLIYLFMEEPEGLKCHCRTKHNFPYISPFVYSLLSRCCFVFLSLWNDWKLLRFLWAARFTGGGERSERTFVAFVLLKKGVTWLRWGQGLARTERLSHSGWGTLTRRVKKTWSDSKESWQAGRWGRSSGAKLRRNSKRCARSPFLAAERDVLFHQSCEAFRPCGYLITLISARLSLFRWTSGILMKAKTAHGEKLDLTALRKSTCTVDRSKSLPAWLSWSGWSVLLVLEWF